MGFETRRETEEICFQIVRDFYRMQKGKGYELPYFLNREYVNFHEFAKKIAKVTANKFFDMNLAVEDEDVVEKLWIETTIEETNEMLNSICMAGYQFCITNDKYLHVISPDGKKHETDKLDCIETAVNSIIADDIFRAVTGREYNPLSAEEEEKNIHEKLMNIIGIEISYTEICYLLMDGSTETFDFISALFRNIH